MSKHDWSSSNDITGVILAGGKSKRMGRDKALLPLAGKSMIEIMIDRLSTIFNSLMIVTSESNGLSKLDIPIAIDSITGFGPLGGIYTALQVSEMKYVFVTACDMPFINLDLIGYMCEDYIDYDLIVPRVNVFFQPLYAIYSKACIPAIEKLISEDNRRIFDFYDDVKVKLISTEDVERFDPDGQCFTNINTIEEYNKYLM